MIPAPQNAGPPATDCSAQPAAGRLHRYWVAYLVFTLAAVSVLVAGSWLYLRQEQLMRRNVEANLAAIAQLKAEQIVAWRSERFGDARVMAESDFLKEPVARWLAQPEDKLGNQIQTRFRAMERYNQYSDVLLVDEAGAIRLRAHASAVTLHAASRQGVAAAWQTRQPVWIDLHDQPGEPRAHLEIIAPLTDANTPTNQPPAAVILRFEGWQFLFPMIQHWPTASASAETLLVRREGDAAVVLNDLRHQTNAALRLRTPLRQTNSPAVQAALGQEGVWEGTDYRGVKVLAFLKQVPNSPWALVSKIDRAEALADWQHHADLLIGCILVLLLACGTMLVVIWREQNRAGELAQADTPP